MRYAFWQASLLGQEEAYSPNPEQPREAEMTVAALSTINPFAATRTAPPHLPRVGAVRVLRPVPKVTAIRPTNRVAIYQLRPDGRLNMLELAPARRAFQTEPLQLKIGTRLDTYA